MSTTLLKIQKWAKVGKVLSTIVMVCCIVGAIGCAVGIAVLRVYGNTAIPMGGGTISGMISQSAEISADLLTAMIALAAVLALGESILASCARKTFGLELEVGTPFDFRVADAFKRLGIRTIVIPIITEILAVVVYQTVCFVYGLSGDMDRKDTISIGLGVAFLIVSLLCRYGAEEAERTMAAGYTEETYDPTRMAP